MQLQHKYTIFHYYGKSMAHFKAKTSKGYIQKHSSNFLSTPYFPFKLLLKELLKRVTWLLRVPQLTFSFPLDYYLT